MSNVKLRIAIALALLVFATSFASIRATDYNPGVSSGQYAKYGNFYGTGSSSTFNDADWMRIDVVDVSEKNVTLHMSGMYKNGTNADESGSIVNVETGAVNGSSGGYFIVIAANLKEGDVIPGAVGPTGPLTINTTDTRSYLGASRAINILNLTTSTGGYMDYSYIEIYDQVSGILLELNMSATSTLYPASNMQMSFSITETNIFSASPIDVVANNLIYIVIAVVLIIIVVAAVVLMRRKKPAPPAETKTPPTTPQQ